jgi:hypothetical protein
MKVLFNDCYGGFAFSEAFEEEYKTRTGKPTRVDVRLPRLLGPESIRTDPVAIAIWEEKGSEWCSGTDSALEMYEVPAVFEKYWEIEDYDGNETVRLLISEALADCLHDYMDTDDKRTLHARYTAILEAAGIRRRVASPTLLRKMTLLDASEGCVAAEPETDLKEDAAKKAVETIPDGISEFGSYFGLG